MKNLFVVNGKRLALQAALLLCYLVSHSGWGQGIPNVHWTKPGIAGKTVITSGGQIATLNNGVNLYSPQGNLLWSVPKVDVYSDPSSTPEGLGALPNDSLVLVSKGIIPRYIYSYRGVSTLTPTGNERRSQIVEESFTSTLSTFQDVVGIPTGGFALISNKSFNNKTTTVVRTRQWTTEIAHPYSLTGTTDYSATKSEKIINTPDGGFLVVGYYNTAGIIGDPFNAANPSVGWVAKVDGQGNILWQKLLQNFQFPNSMSGADPGAVLSTYAITDVTLAADGNGFILVGSGYGFSAITQAPPRTVMLELDLNGNLKRSKVYPVDPTPAYVTKYKGNDGKLYYALGNTDLSVPGFDYRVLKISADAGLASDPASLSLLAQRTFSLQYDGTPQERLSDIQVAGDGGLVLMGTGGLIKLLPDFANPLAVIQPLYNCNTKQFWFRSSGGDGSPVSFMAIGITPWSTTAGPYTVPESPDAEAFTLIARQASNPSAVTTLVWDWRIVCGTPNSTTPTNGTITPGPTQCGSATPTIGQPLTLLPPNYDCATGSIRFNVSGGNGSPIEFLSVGITGWTTNCQSQIDSPDLMADIRNPNSTIEPFTLYARQRNPDGTLMVVQLKWDAKSVCTGAGLVATEKESGNLQVTALGNPTRSETVEVEVSGGAGQRIQLEVTNLQGQPISELLLDQRTTPVRVRLWVGPSAGLRLIRACTATQQKIIKILKQ